MAKGQGANREQRAPVKTKVEQAKTAKQEKRAAEVLDKREMSRSKMGKMGGEKGAAGVKRDLVFVVGRQRPDGTWSGKGRWFERGSEEYKRAMRPTS